MRTILTGMHIRLALITLAGYASAALAADPGLPFPPTSEVNDQKAGSVLVYNLYTSNATGLEFENTEISITNTSETANVAVHFFFVKGDTCSVKETVRFLFANQKISFLVSEVVPNETGYIIAVATDITTGCPISFNHLIGSAYFRRAFSGHAASLGAEAIAALYSGALASCSSASTIATLAFNGVSYNRIPRMLTLDKIASPANSNSTILVVNRIGGDLTSMATPIGPISGTLFDDAENHFGFTIPIAAPPRCQIDNVLSGTFPVTVPPFSSVIPDGRTGWMKFAPPSEFGILGAAIRIGPVVKFGPAISFLGHNLHKLTLSEGNSVTMPLFITNPQPAILCPSDVIAVAAKPRISNLVVNFPSPNVMDNSPGATVVCLPPSGSGFPTGATTITCTVTDSGGATASCSFTVTVWDVSIQDDHSGDVLLFNSSTGAYSFTRCGPGGFAMTGIGKVSRTGCLTRLEDDTRVVSAEIDRCLIAPRNSGTAAIKQTRIGATFPLKDSNILNNTGICP